MANELLVLPQDNKISREYFNGTIKKLQSENEFEFDLFRAFVWTNLSPQRFEQVITQTPEKIEAFIKTRDNPNQFLEYIHETNTDIMALSQKNKWLERRSEYRYQVAQHVTEDLAFKFLNDSIENFELAQHASKQGLQLMNELLSLGLADPLSFKGRNFSDVAQGMRVIFDEARLYSGNPTENIQVRQTVMESDETKEQLDTLLSKIDEIKEINDDEEIIEAEYTKND